MFKICLFLMLNFVNSTQTNNEQSTEKIFDHLKKTEKGIIIISCLVNGYNLYYNFSNSAYSNWQTFIINARFFLPPYSSTKILTSYAKFASPLGNIINLTLQCDLFFNFFSYQKFKIISIFSIISSLFYLLVQIILTDSLGEKNGIRTINLWITHMDHRLTNPILHGLTTIINTCILLYIKKRTCKYIKQKPFMKP